MLSDEKEEIFNNLKDYMQSNIDNGYHKFIYNDLGWDFKCIDCINAIDKVLKQSKEIEELKEENKTLKNLQNDTNRLYTEMIERKNYFERELQKLEDKIKAKIEESELLIDNSQGCMSDEDLYKEYGKIEFGQSLLEKE